MTAQTGNKMENSREPKVGDVVHVRMTVTKPPREGYCYAEAPASGHFVIDPADIVHIEPAPLKVGDRVHGLNNGTAVGEICFLDSVRAAVQWGGGVYDWPYLACLTRIEASDGAGS